MAYYATCLRCYDCFLTQSEYTAKLGGTCPKCRAKVDAAQKQERKKQQHQTALDACWLGVGRER